MPLKLAKVLGKGIEWGGLGAGFSLGKSMEEEDEPIEVAKKTFIGGITSGIIGMVIGGVGVTLENVPQKLYDSALRISKRIQKAGKDPSKELLKQKGMWGSLGKIKGRVETGIYQLNEKIKNLVGDSKMTVKSEVVLDGALNQMKKRYGVSYSRAQLDEILRKLPIQRLKVKKYVTLKELNDLRVQLDLMLGDRVWLTQTQHPIKKEAMRILSNTLRNTVKNNLPSTKPVFKDFSTLLETKKIVDDVISSTGKNIFGFGDWVATGVGGAIGVGIGAASGVGTGLVPVIGVPVARRILGSPFVKTGIAKLIYNIAKSEGMKGVSKTLFLDLLKEAEPDL